MSSYCNVCRICLGMNGEFSNIYEFAPAIMECAPIIISPNDGYPSVICEECLDKLQAAQHFRVLCIQSDIILRQSSKETTIGINENEQPEEEYFMDSSDYDSNGEEKCSTMERSSYKHFMNIDKDPTRDTLLECSPSIIEEPETILSDISSESNKSPQQIVSTPSIQPNIFPNNSQMATKIIPLPVVIQPNTVLNQIRTPTNTIITPTNKIVSPINQIIAPTRTIIAPANNTFILPTHMLNNIIISGRMAQNLLLPSAPIVINQGSSKKSEIVPKINEPIDDKSNGEKHDLVELNDSFEKSEPVEKTDSPVEKNECCRPDEGSSNCEMKSNLQTTNNSSTNYKKIKLKLNETKANLNKFGNEQDDEEMRFNNNLSIKNNDVRKVDELNVENNDKKVINKKIENKIEVKNEEKCTNIVEATTIMKHVDKNENIKANNSEELEQNRNKNKGKVKKEMKLKISKNSDKNNDKNIDKNNDKNNDKNIDKNNDKNNIKMNKRKNSKRIGNVSPVKRRSLRKNKTVTEQMNC